jgi:hypothetical protein
VAGWGQARQRDVNEGEIVRALEAVGATVTRLNEAGVPDLLVGYQGKTKLLEVKRPLGPEGGRQRGGAHKQNQGGDGILTEAQVKWWRGDDKKRPPRPPWQGDPPVIVTTPVEALDAIGAPVYDIMPPVPPEPPPKKRRRRPCGMGSSAPVCMGSVVHGPAGCTCPSNRAATDDPPAPPPTRPVLVP